ncbi:MAG: hypothetical protein R3A79_26175 [Nannocystaceae bacterium]
MQGQVAVGDCTPLQAIAPRVVACLIRHEARVGAATAATLRRSLARA